MSKESSKKNTEISARVARMIEILGQNPNSFAKKLGYGRAQTIYDIIEGKSAPSYDFFNRFVMSEFSVSFNLRWLLAGEGTPFLENIRENDIARPTEGTVTENLICYMKTKDDKILEQAEEIGRLRERIRFLEEKEGNFGNMSDTLESFLGEDMSSQTSAAKIG